MGMNHIKCSAVPCTVFAVVNGCKIRLDLAPYAI